MIFLLAFLSWGWPAERTVWVNSASEVPAGLVAVTINRCCGSMKPAIQGGELAWMEPYKGQQIVEGDIVQTPRFLHRVTAVNSRAIRTSGDANRRSDGWTPLSDIQYILRYVQR